jgi:hypothetical protein
VLCGSCSCASCPATDELAASRPARPCVPNPCGLFVRSPLAGRSGAVRVVQKLSETPMT